MLRLRDLMQRDVLAVSPDLTLRELVEIFSEEGVSGAPVVANDTVIGVISTTDILDFQEESAGLSLAPGASEDEPETARRKRGSSTPASEFFSEGWEPPDIDALQWMRSTRTRDWDILDQHSVGDVMTRDVLSLPSDATVKSAARFMLEAGVHRLLVIDGGELQGIVTTTDIVRAVAEGKLKG
ncbi:MAG: CBS domain-containing protein [Gemmatimonadota bacterium]|nr:MAG: CBS domain-containing protein [Gemmatimonadota bacterium]